MDPLPSFTSIPSLKQTSETGRPVSLLALRDPHLTGYPHLWGKATTSRSRLIATVFAGELFSCQLSEQHALSIFQYSEINRKVNMIFFLISTRIWDNITKHLFLTNCVIAKVKWTTQSGT